MRRRAASPCSRLPHRVGDIGRQAVGERSRRRRVVKCAGLAVGDELRVAADPGCHDRYRARHRLEDGVRDAFVQRGEHEHVHRTQQVRHVTARTGEPDAAGERVPARRVLERASFGALPRDDQTQAVAQPGVALRDPMEGLDQCDLVLDRVEAAHRTEHDELATARRRATADPRARCLPGGRAPYPRRCRSDGCASAARRHPARASVAMSRDMAT